MGEMVKQIAKEITKILVSQEQCNKSGHYFIPLQDGTNDVICTRCGVKAMRAVASFNKK